MDANLDGAPWKANGHADAGNPSAPLCLSLADWMARDIAEPDFLLGHVLSTTTRAMFAAPTGLGKTHFAMALGFGMASGAGFLHWKGHRPARVLLVDGEMSRRLFKRRLADAIRREGCAPAGLYAVCRDDVESMPPLDTPAGQAFIDKVIADIGGIDFVIFDNIMSLISGDMKEEDGWGRTLPWVRDLTKRSIGQAWIHHTGYDRSHGYGTSTREWQLDVSVLFEEARQPGADIAFTLSFTKARERSPDTRADFEPVTVTLSQDRWFSQPSEPAPNKPAAKKPSPKALSFHRALTDALAANGKLRPQSANRPSVTMDEWKAECTRLAILASGAKDQDAGQRSLFSKYRLELIAAEWVACNGDFAWSLNRFR